MFPNAQNNLVKQIPFDREICVLLALRNKRERGETKKNTGKDFKEKVVTLVL